MSNDHPWLTTREVAERLNFSARTIQRLIAEGRFDPLLRSSSHSLRISLESVERFEREHLSTDGNAPFGQGK